jgi:hypothetical protein
MLSKPLNPTGSSGLGDGAGADVVEQATSVISNTAASSATVLRVRFGTSSMRPTPCC